MKKFAGILIVSLIFIGGSALPAEAKTKPVKKPVPVKCIKYHQKPGTYYPAVCRIGLPRLFWF